MADKDTKIADLKTDEKKFDPKAPPAPEPEEHHDEHHDEPAHEMSAADKVKAEVEPKTDVESAVQAFIEHAMLEVTAVAGESQKTITDLAEHFTEKAAEFAALIASKIKDTEAERGYGESGEKPPASADHAASADAEREKLMAAHYDHPHNDAAASAVAHGMEPRTANYMTTIGSNT